MGREETEKSLPRRSTTRVPGVTGILPRFTPTLEAPVKFQPRRSTCRVLNRPLIAKQSEERGYVQFL
jgi:hypothetical protein